MATLADSVSQDKPQGGASSVIGLIGKLIDLAFNNSELHNHLKDEIIRCFGVDNIEALISKKCDKKKSEIIWKTCNSNHSEPTKHQLIIVNSDVQFKTVLFKELSPRITDITQRITDIIQTHNKDWLAEIKLALAEQRA